MSATDYAFILGMNTAYLCKKNKSKSTMSTDRRVVTDNEIIALFEYYLKRFCIDNKSAMLGIRDADGNVLFEASPKGKMLEEIKELINE